MSNSTPKEPAGLADHSCISDRNFRAGTSWSFGDGKSAEMVNVQSRITVDGAAAVRRLLLAGQGIARIPSFVVGPDLREGRLVPILTKFEPAPLGIFATYPQNRFLTARVRSLVDFAAKQLARPSWDQGG